MSKWFRVELEVLVSDAQKTHLGKERMDDAEFVDDELREQLAGSFLAMQVESVEEAE